MFEIDYILFKDIPDGIKKNKCVKVVLIELSGIQKYIFGGITINTSANEITNNSQYIIKLTDGIVNWIADKYINSDIRLLNVSSGKIFLAISAKVNQSDLENDLKELQRIIYASTIGRLEMFYSFCDAKITNKENKIKKGNAVSRLSLGVNLNKYHCTNIINMDMQKYVNEALCDYKVNKMPDGSIMNKEIYMAVKLDLDNLGMFFNGLIEFDTRKKASQALNDALLESAASVKEIIPIFVGGDDIFFIVSINNYLICLYAIYNKLRCVIKSRKELDKYCEFFGLSAGCCEIRGDLKETQEYPLYYYYYNSEKELENAKSAEGKNVISIGGVLITWEQLEILSSIIKNKYDIVVGMLDRNQQLIYMLNIKKLVERIIILYKNKMINLTKEQERVLREIK